MNGNLIAGLQELQALQAQLQQASESQQEAQARYDTEASDLRQQRADAVAQFDASQSAVDQLRAQLKSAQARTYCRAMCSLSPVAAQLSRQHAYTRG